MFFFFYSHQKERLTPLTELFVCIFSPLLYDQALLENRPISMFFVLCGTTEVVGSWLVLENKIMVFKTLTDLDNIFCSKSIEGAILSC